MGFLRVSGTDIVDESGHAVTLHGIGLGGWLTMENWIVGFPGHEHGMRDSVQHVLGKARADFFFDRFLENFFTADDAKFISNLGINVVRIPFHYEHLESDDAPFEVLEKGIRILDRAIAVCAEHGLYTILDLHNVPGWQNQDWHSDNPTHTAQFWRHRTFRDRVVHLWEALAARYAKNPWVAGYNPLNEPADPSGKVVSEFYRTVVNAIRKVDEEHIIFLDGNRYGMDFQVFGDPEPNTIYSVHDYPAPAYMPHSRYPGYCHLTHILEPEQGKTYGVGLTDRRGSSDQYFDKEVIEEGFLGRSKYMRETGTPIVVGEFNAIFTGDGELDTMRLQLLADQLDIYKKHNASWIYWGYKDIGLASPLSVGQDSEWLRRIRPVVEKKARLGVDLWGGRLDRIDHIMKPLRELFAAEFPGYSPFPFGSEFMINRLVPQILLAEAMLPEFGERFRGMTEEDIDEMMKSFRLENCQPRKELLELIRLAAN